MRKRFRGNQTIAMSKEVGGGGEPGTQLYAGRPAVGGVAGTDGSGDAERK